MQPSILIHPKPQVGKYWIQSFWQLNHLFSNFVTFFSVTNPSRQPPRFLNHFVHCNNVTSLLVPAITGTLTASHRSLTESLSPYWRIMSDPISIATALLWFKPPWCPITGADHLYVPSRRCIRCDCQLCTVSKAIPWIGLFSCFQKRLIVVEFLVVVTSRFLILTTSDFLSRT